LNQKIIGAVLIIFSALGFGSMTIFATYAYRGGITVATMLFIRFCIATVILFIYVGLRYGRPQVRGKDFFALFILGAVFYTTQSSFYLTAIRYISASLAAIILYIFPLFVAGLSIVFFRERLKAKTVVAMALSFLGLAFVLWTSFASIDYRGVLLALGAALIYSLYIVLGNKVVRDLPAPVMSAFISLFTAAGIFCYGSLSGQLHFDFQATAWSPVIGLALCSTVLAMLFFFRGLEIVGPTNAAILSMAEPLFTVALSVLLLGEALLFQQILGGAAILGGAGLVIASQNEKSTRNEEYI
jgi:drug/metabolite transporter (DMT)-like permease